MRGTHSHSHSEAESQESLWMTMVAIREYSSYLESSSGSTMTKDWVGRVVWYSGAVNWKGAQLVLQTPELNAFPAELGFVDCSGRGRPGFNKTDIQIIA